MLSTILSLIVSIIALAIALIAFFQTKQINTKTEPVTDKFNAVPLQLQAYERLVLFTERISLPNLISRLNLPQLSAKEMQLLLLENIKQEFEYNTSQQIYVSNIAWDAVRNLKDQNMLLINQIANLLPPNARAGDLNKQLIEVVMNQKEAALHSIVLNELNFEAKKILSTNSKGK